MTDTEDMTLLKEWAHGRREGAFRAVVERYAGLVFGVALRRTGERALAEEAVQNVFTDLARKAGVIVELQRPLAAWLHRSAVYEAATLLRSETRHREKMKHYATNTPEESAPDPWAEVRPLLDNAINALGEADRRVLLLHWFERRTFADIAEKTGASAAAVQRRGLRALDKLAGLLRRRGVVVPVAVLAAGLTPQLSQAAPSGLAAAVSGVATHAVPAAGGLATFLQQTLYVMNSAKLTTAAVVLVAAAIPVSVQYAAANKPMRAERAYDAKGAGAGPAEAGSPATAGAGKLDLTLVQQALRRLRANPEDYETQLALRRLMFALSAEEIPGVQKLLLESSGKEALYEVAFALYARWAELDPAAAIKAATEVSKPAFGFYPLRGAFITWASADLDTAWKWLEGRTDAMERTFLGGEALATMVAFKGNGRAMMERVDAMKDEAWRKELRFWVLRSWAQRGAPVELMDWALKLPQNEEREERIAACIEQMGVTRPDVAPGYLKHIENTARRNEAAHNILWPYMLARHPGDMHSPPDFVENLYDRTNDFAPEIFRDAGEAIARHGAKWAMEKLQRFPEGAARDEFIQGMLRSAANTEAKAMLPAVAMLSEEALMRHGGLSNFTEVLTKQDARAAAEWLQSLPAESKVREWAGSHFESITGKSAEQFLQSSSK